MGLKLANNALSRLAASISPTDTTITLVPGGGAVFPTLVTGDYFPATIVKTDGSLEIVKVTARATDVLTVVRGQESTTAKAFNAGDRFELRLTAGTYAAQFTDVDSRLSTQNNLRPSGTALTPIAQWPTVPQLVTDNADLTDEINAQAQALANRSAASARWAETIIGFDATGAVDKSLILFNGRDTAGDGGGGPLRFLSGSTATANGVTVYAVTGGRLVREGWSVFGINVKWAGAKGDGNQATGAGTDDTAAFNLAIAALGGTQDLGSAYIYQPAKKLRIPQGVYILSGQILANRNNIILEGEGTFNTVLMCSRSVQISNLVRFQGAYACQLNHLTIDGGLPFTPTGSETYGSDVGLTLDQVAHFSSIGLNICNTRYEGKRCIHLWESYFEDLRIFNTGFFGNASNRSAGIRFTQVGKLDNTFPGGESNNIVYNKVSFGTVGSYVSADEVPTYNIFFNDVIAEGRTWSTNYASLGEVKWRVGGTASNFVIDTGYSFPHAQPFACNATLFDFSNVGPGCRVRNYRVYQSLDSTYQEVTRILSCDSNFLIEVDISVEEVGSNSTVLINSSTISNVAGSWEYRSSLARTRSSLFTGTSESRFTGRLLLRDSAAITPYQYRGKAVAQGVIDGDTAVRPQYAAYAFANVDGRSTGGPRTLRGLTYSRLSTGQYQFTFTQAMPDAAYAVMVSADVLNNASERPEVGAQTNTGFTVVNRAGGSYYDPSNVNVVVFR